MSYASPDKALQPFYAKKTRTLEQAARAALEIAAAEQLPVSATYRGDPENWHRATILKTVPVYGKRDRRRERVPATAHLFGDHAALDFGEWCELTVKAADFQRYLDWLHSVW